MNQIIVIHSLLGNYSHIAGEIDKATGEIHNTPPQISGQHNPEQCHAGEFPAICCCPGARNDSMIQENASLREELNELYLMYDGMSAALSEIRHLLKAAITTAENTGREVQP